MTTTLGSVVVAGRFDGLDLPTSLMNERGVADSTSGDSCDLYLLRVATSGNTQSVSIRGARPSARLGDI